MNALRHLPLTLSAVRGALGPVVLVLSFVSPQPDAFAICLVVALLSDDFDGVIARRLEVATPKLRRLDSAADSVFYISALIAAWHLHPVLLEPYLGALGFLLALELFRHGFDYKKFGKEASYPMWSSKLWGVALFAAFISVLVHGKAGWPVGTAIALGISADLEGLAISAVLVRWRADVPTIFHAIRRSRAHASPGVPAVLPQGSASLDVGLLIALLVASAS